MLSDLLGFIETRKYNETAPLLDSVRRCRDDGCI